jgi:hypothetical protein
MEASLRYVVLVSLTSASYNVLYLMPQVRHTAALLVPFFMTYRMATIVSSLLYLPKPLLCEDFNDHGHHRLTSKIA